MRNIHEVAKILLDAVEGASDEVIVEVLRTYSSKQGELLSYVEDVLIPEYEKEAIPVQEHPLRDEIIKMLKDGKLTIS